MHEYLIGLKSIAYNETEAIETMKNKNYRTEIVFPSSLKALDVGYIDFSLFFNWICKYPKILEKNEWKLLSFAKDVLRYETGNCRYKGQRIEMPENFLNVLELETIKNYVRSLCENTQSKEHLEDWEYVHNHVKQKFCKKQKPLEKLEYEYA